MITRTIAAGVLATGLALASATVGHAQKPDIVEQYDDTFSVLDPFLSGICGFDIWVDGDIRGTFRARGSSVQVNERGTVVFSANGKTLTQNWVRNIKGTMTETIDKEAGTVTMVFHDVFNGIPERIRNNDGETVLMDRGRAAVTTTLVFDLETGEVLSYDEEYETNGPHPILDQGFLDPSQLCEPLAP